MSTLCFHSDFRRIGTHLVACVLAAWVLAITIASAGGAAEATLARAIQQQEWDVAEKLIADKEQIALAQPDGMTAMHWAAFHKQTQPVIEYYRSKCILSSINADQPFKKVYDDITRALAKKQ